MYRLKVIIKLILGLIIVLFIADLNNPVYSKEILFSNNFFFINNVMGILILIHLIKGISKFYQFEILKKYLEIIIILYLGLNIMFWIYRIYAHFLITEFISCVIFASCSLYVFIKPDRTTGTVP